MARRLIAFLTSVGVTLADWFILLVGPEVRSTSEAWTTRVKHTLSQVYRVQSDPIVTKRFRDAVSPCGTTFGGTSGDHHRYDGRILDPTKSGASARARTWLSRR